ncbi:MAG: ComEA family DNA-binding protein [Chloroflexota bacterium]
MPKKLSHQVIVAVLLVFMIAGCGLAFFTGCHPDSPVAIDVPDEPELTGMVYIDGAVSVPGAYPFRGDDTIESLIQAAGGTGSITGPNQFKLYVSVPGEEEPQKIDINRAEAWLLEVLPDIGETLAMRIVAYREQNGPFRNVRELTRVEGIGIATLDKIENLVTVSD